MNTRTKSFAIVNQVKLLCASILILGASAAYSNPAAVIDEFKCSSFFPDGNGGLDYSFLISTTTEAHKVITDKGVNILSCHFDHEEDLPYARGAQGFVCGIRNGEGFLLLTTDSKMLAAPGGRATLVCKINGDEI